MKQKRVLIVCTGCKRSVDLQRALQRREHAGGVVELGSICPKCKKWTHALYETNRTRAAQAVLKAAPYSEREAALAAYNEIYAAEQKRVAEELTK